MSDRPLSACRVLVAEDEYLLADELQIALEDAGAVVIGPFGSLAGLLLAIETEKHIHGAILDANLAGEMVFPAADILIELGVPVIFTTGYDASIIPKRFGAITRCEKPLNIRRVIELVGHALRN